MSEIPDSNSESGISDISPDGGSSATWTGETGLITDVVRRLSTSTAPTGLAGAHAYVCGPPPMVEAAIPLLETLGVEDKRIYYDKFTTTGEPS
jgi:propane monooxygenase reductase subunit